MRQWQQGVQGRRGAWIASCAVVCAVAALAWPTGVRAQGASTDAGEPGAGQIEAALRQTAGKLGAADAQAFFELGEEASDAAARLDSLELRALATQLLVTAHELARQSPAGGRGLRVSALLALGDTLPLRADRERVRALAARLDPAGAGVLLRGSTGEERVGVGGAAGSGAGPASEQSVDYLCALLLGSARSGDTSRARALLRRSDVRERLESLDRTLARAGVSGGVTRVLEDAQRGPCNVCGGGRLERLPRSTDQRLCTQCRGIPGRTLSENELLAWLRVEGQLLGIDHASWAAQRALDGGEALAIIDDENLPLWLGMQPLVEMGGAGEAGAAEGPE